MSETIATCITQIITTLITVGVTILVAFKTYRSQKNKEEQQIQRLQTINCNSSLELFHAYMSNLILFASPKEIDLDSETLHICLQKMRLTEQYLEELAEADLPDSYIEDFRFYRIKLAFHRIALENRLNANPGKSVRSSIFDDLDTLSLISSINDFVSSKKTEG